MNTSFTNDSDIAALEKHLINLKSESYTAYVFYSLIYTYGISQDDLFKCTVRDLFFVPFDSKKYSDVAVSKEYYSFFSQFGESTYLSEIFPSRAALYSSLNRHSPFPISPTKLLKTWAYKRLCSGTPLEEVMQHFNYQHSRYSFIIDYLGLSPNTCMNNEHLIVYYLNASFSEFSLYDYSHISKDQLVSLCDYLSLISSVLGGLI